MNSFLKRALSGAVLVVIMVAGILTSVTTLLVLALLIMTVSMMEFFGLANAKEKSKETRSRLNDLFPVLIGAAIVTTSYSVVWLGISAEWFLLLIPALFLVFVTQLYRKKTSPMRRVGEQLTAIIYIAVPMAFLLALGVRAGMMDEPVYNPWLVLFYVVLIWINDVGAFLVGMSIGKHRLFERISPKKSWEGFFGGLVFTVLAAVLIGPKIAGMQNSPVWMWIIFGVVLTLSAVAGDLVESMFKREAGVKDSGNIIPGHGGFLDRFDAMFISLPFVYGLIRLMA